MTAESNPRIFLRAARVTVDGLAIAGSDDTGDLSRGLRVGFTIEKDLLPHPNHAEVVIYNLSRDTRTRLHMADAVPVVIEAGYRDTGLFVIFAGEMREAFSRPEADGTWATILRAGDGDTALRKKRRATSKRPGVSFDRVVSETFGSLKIGAGNLWAEMKNQLKGDFDTKKLTDAFASGFNGAGSAAEEMVKLMQAAGLEMSVQDGEVQIIKAGEILSTTATLLSPRTGLEGSVEVDAKGIVSARAKIVAGLNPGFPVELDPDYVMQKPLTLETGWYAFDALPDPQPTLYRVEKVRYVGDTAGTDWNAELTLAEPASRNAKKKENHTEKAVDP